MNQLRFIVMGWLLCAAAAWGQITAFPIPTTPLAGSPTATTLPSGGKFLGYDAGVLKQFPLNLVTQGVYNVKSYGAVGNGTTDDTAAIAATFTAATAGGTVYFPPGTYVMTSHITIGVDHLTVLGAGAKIISNATGQDRKFTLSGRTGVVFRGLRIDGLSLTTLTAAVAFDTYTPRDYPGTIHFLNCTDCEVTECNIKNVNWPVTLVGSCEDIKINRCTFGGYFAAVYSYFSGAGTSSDPAPKRISVCDNTFNQGIWAPITPAACGDARVYPAVPVHCSGAVKFRSANSVQWNVIGGHVVSGNIIKAAGMMGIELQGDANDSVIAGNTIADVDNGISLSHVQRMVVASNTVRNCNYTCIEVDGRTDDDDETQPSNEGITLVGNVLDMRDECGRPFDFHNNVGIVLSNISRYVTVSGGSISWCKTGILVNDLSGKVLISGVGIRTNGTDSDGGLDTGSQGILIRQSKNVDIVGCRIEPVGNERQRMINILESQNVSIRSTKIISNKSCVYVYDSNNVTVDGGCELGVGPNMGGTIAGFLVVESQGANCTHIRLRNSVLKGTFTEGIYLYVPGTGRTIEWVTAEGNNTEQAACTAPNFVGLNPSVGTIGRVELRNNTGPGDGSPQKHINIPVATVTATFNDSPQYEVLICDWLTTVNLQTAVGYAGKRKIIYYGQGAAGLADKTIHPKTSENINGSASDVVLTVPRTALLLESDGAHWVAAKLSAP